MRLILAAAAAIALTACGSEQSGTFEGEDGETGTYSVDEDDGVTRAEIKTSDGTAKMESGAGVTAKLPAGFSIFPGAKVVTTTNISSGDGSGTLVSLTSTEAPEKLVSHYKKQAEAAGIDIQMEMKTEDGTMIAGEGKNGTGFSFTASKTDEGTSATLMVGSDFN